MKTLLLLFLVLSHPALAEGPQPFGRGSWQELRKEHAGRPMIVHFWGVTCGPCLAELPRWGEFIREKPGIDIVMVAAAPVVGERSTIAGVLAKAGCASAESWMFADPFTDRLAYEVAPSWSGALPFTLLIRADGSVTAVLGAVEFSELHAWVVQQSRPTTGSRGKSRRDEERDTPNFVLAGLVPAIHGLERLKRRRGYAEQVRARRLEIICCKPWTSLGARTFSRTALRS